MSLAVIQMASQADVALNLVRARKLLEQAAEAGINLAGEALKANRDKIIALYDERFFRMWEFYLAGGVVAFENGSMCNFQAQYIRDRYALPLTAGVATRAASAAARTEATTGS